MSDKRTRVAMQPPVRLQVYVWATVAAAHLALAAAFVHNPVPAPRELIVAVLLAVMVGVAHSFPVQLAPRLRLSADTAPAFAATLLLPPPLAIAVSVAGIGGGEAVRRGHMIQVAYNIAVAALRASAATTAFTLLSPLPLMDNPEAWRASLAFLAAGLAMYAANVILIDAVVAVQRKINPLRGWWARRRGQLPHEVSLYLLGTLVAVIGARWAGGLVLITVPSVIVYRSLRDGMAARMQSRNALQEMADMVDSRDPYTAGHSRRVADLARAVALKMGLNADDSEMVYLAARVLDVGKLGISSTMFSKSGLLTDTEWQDIRSHPRAGATLLARFPEYAAGRELVLYHHERWDGRGYPHGLCGEQIPVGARIISVADAFVAMVSDRAFRRALAPEIVRDEFRRGSGVQFDPRVIDALFAVLNSHPEFAERGEAAPASVRQRSAA
jgi:HD-GYP domain-containing protein (c-di-GMP phosphodiesterase class II)